MSLQKRLGMNLKTEHKNQNNLKIRYIVLLGRLHKVAQETSQFAYMYCSFCRAFPTLVWPSPSKPLISFHVNLAVGQQVMKLFPRLANPDNARGALKRYLKGGLGDTASGVSRGRRPLPEKSRG